MLIVKYEIRAYLISFVKRADQLLLDFYHCTSWRLIPGPVNMSVTSALQQIWKASINSSNFTSVLKKDDILGSPLPKLVKIEEQSSHKTREPYCDSARKKQPILMEKCKKQVQLVSAANGKCTAEMSVAEEHSNMNGTMHGGFTTTLVDVISGMALISDGKSNIGVSVDMHITFLNAAPIGDQIVIEAKTNKAGRTLAFLDVVIKSKLSGKIIATGSHTKFVA